MTPVGKILQRNLERIDPDRGVFWFNPTTDDTWRLLQEQAKHLATWSQDFADFTKLKSTGAPIAFGAFPEHEHGEAQRILTLPRSKQRLAMLLDYMASNMSSKCQLWLVGENRAGIKSAITALKQRFASVCKIDSAAHCVLFEARSPLVRQPFKLAEYRLEWCAESLPGKPIIHSYPGVFAHGKADPGSAMLIEQLSHLSRSGSVLDFGSGCGLISACFGSMEPDSQITMTDVDALAVLSSSKTMAANGLAATVCAADGLVSLEQRFDLVMSNPPFHQGARTDMEFGMKLLQDVRNFLNPRGQFIMVANRHLPYRQWLDRIFGSHRVLLSNNQFQVLIAVQSP